MYFRSKNRGRLTAHSPPPPPSKFNTVLNIDHAIYYSLQDYMKYKPEEEEELDAKTKQYIRMGELLREKTTDLTQLIVM